MFEKTEFSVGIVDLYGDNWHTNYYPIFLRAAALECGVDMAVEYAYFSQNAPSGETPQQWCKRLGQITLCPDYDTLIAVSDAIMVMCADDVFPHEQLAQKALSSGKPVFCDKTFAPDIDAAKRMFALAEAHGTPLFSTSAQRYCPDLTAYCKEISKPISFAATTGPGDLVNYSVHQLEMLEAVMGTGARDVIAFPANNSVTAVIRYEGERYATFVQSPNAMFSMSASDDVADWYSVNKKTNRNIVIGEFYIPFMKQLIKFFLTGKSPITREDTLEVVAIQQAIREAKRIPGTYIPVPVYKEET